MKRIFIPLILLVLLSCGETEKQFFHIEGSDVVETAMLNNKFTVFCYIDSTDCDPCALLWLHRWNYFEDELNKLNTNVALIVRSSDEKAIQDAMAQMRLNYPVIFDGNSTIKISNEAILNRHSVFVVNHKKEVIWLGLPIECENSWNSFLKHLRRHK